MNNEETIRHDEAELREEELAEISGGPTAVERPPQPKVPQV